MRVSKQLKRKPVLFIACEGTATEYDYFKSWAQTDEATENYSNIRVYPNTDKNDEEEDENPHTNPYELYLKAKEMLDNGSTNEAWVVFDKDNHPKLPETFAAAQNDGVKIAFSSRSFEEWILHHYERNVTPFQATECKVRKKPLNCGTAQVPHCTPVNCLTGHLRRQNYLANYTKKKKADIYGSLNNLVEKAFVNAAYLRFRTGTSLPPFANLHLQNPYTNIDELIFTILGRRDKMVWGSQATSIMSSGWTIRAVRIAPNIIVQVSHTFPQAELTARLQDKIFFVDSDLNNNTVASSAQQFYDNKNGSTPQLLYSNDIWELTFTDAGHPFVLFKADENLKFYIEL